MSVVLPGPAMDAGSPVFVLAVTKSPPEASGAIIALTRGGLIGAYPEEGNPEAGTSGDDAYIKLRGRASRPFDRGDVQVATSSYDVVIQYSNLDIPISTWDRLMGIVSPVPTAVSTAAGWGGNALTSVGDVFGNIGEGIRGAMAEYKWVIIIGAVALALVALAIVAVYVRPWAPGG